MRTTIKLRIHEVTEAEVFIQELKTWLKSQKTNVSLAIGDTRWSHYGIQTKIQAKEVSQPAAQALN